MVNESSEDSLDHSQSSSSSGNQTKKVPMAKTIEPEVKTSHPKTSVMVDEAIQELAPHGAMSLQTIKKTVSAKYGPISEIRSKNINKYIKKAIADGSLVQPKGKTGISASFKLPSTTARKVQRKAAKVAKSAESPLKKLASKTAPKATTANKSSKTTKLRKDATKTTPKSPMAKKITKSPTSKPKAPKPKKVNAATKSPKPAAKKTVAAKK